MKPSHLIITAAGAALAPLAAAQSNPVPHRVQAAAGQAFFEINAIRETSNGAGQSYCGFTTAGGDSVFELAWFYRLTGESRNSWFNVSASNPQVVTTPATYMAGPPETGLNVGSMAVDWADVDGKGFDATWGIAVTQSAPDHAIATHQMTIANPSAAPLTLEIICYVDIDVSGFFDVDNRVQANSGFLVLDGLGSDYVHLGVDPLPARWEVDTFFGDLDGRIGSVAAPYDLGNTGLPFGPDDWTGAYQWQLTVAPSSSDRVEVSIGRNICVLANAAPANLRRYGAATPRPAGPLRLNASMPRLGSTFEIFVGNGPADGSITLLLGATAIAAPFCGIELLVDPWASIPIALDPVGSGSLPISIYCEAGLAGQEIFAQAFAIDPTGPSTCFPLVNSDGVRATIGL